MSGSHVRVVRIITDADMRFSRRLVDEEWKVFTQLTRGQVVLLVNRSGTIARFVDAARTLHTLYAEDGEVFDVPVMTELINSKLLAIGLNLIKGENVATAPEKHLSLPPKPKPKVKKRKAKAAIPKENLAA